MTLRKLDWMAEARLKIEDAQRESAARNMASLMAHIKNCFSTMLGGRADAKTEDYLSEPMDAPPARPIKNGGRLLQAIFCGGTGKTASRETEA